MGGQLFGKTRVLQNARFSGMIQYADSIENVSEGQLGGFFVGWSSPPSQAQHLAILAGSSHVVLAIADARVVGFITAVSDGMLSA